MQHLYILVKKSTEQILARAERKENLIGLKDFFAWCGIHCVIRHRKSSGVTSPRDGEESYGKFRERRRRAERERRKKEKASGLLSNLGN